MREDICGRKLFLQTLCGLIIIWRERSNVDERGDAGVSMGIYATVLFVLGMADRVGDLADPRTDALGLALEDERLPKRVRLPRKREEGT